MPLVDSRLGPGTLLFGTTDASFQAANVRLVPDVSETDGTPTLAVPDPAPDADVGWTLQGSIVQDFLAGADAFVHWLADNALSEQPFTFTPKTGAGLSYAGTVKVYPVEIGGDAASQVTSDFSMPIVGDIVRTDPAGP